jgi:hypothetical protein
VRALLIALLIAEAAASAFAADAPPDPNQTVPVLTTQVAYWKAFAEAQYHRAEAERMKTAQQKAHEEQAAAVQAKLPALTDAMKKACGDKYTLGEAGDCVTAKPAADKKDAQ